MTIRFTKGKKGKPSVLTCFRADGSATWYYYKHTTLILHDFCHYAAETTLALRSGFYGRVASGVNLDANEGGSHDHDYDAMTLTPDTLYAECVANLVEGEFRLLGAGERPFEEVWATVEAACAKGLKNLRNLPPPPNLTPETFALMRSSVRELFSRFQTLRDGEFFELPF